MPDSAPMKSYAGKRWSANKQRRSMFAANHAKTLKKRK